MNQEVWTDIVTVMVKTFAPILIAYVANLARQAHHRAQKEHWYAMALEFASTAVGAAEQLGLTGELEELATGKFAYALAQVEMMLQANGVKLDTDIPITHLKTLIEAEVGRLPNFLSPVYTGEVLHSE